AALYTPKTKGAVNRPCKIQQITTCLHDFTGLSGVSDVSVIQHNLKRPLHNPLRRNPAMTLQTNARIAGFTFLFYIAVAFPSMVLLERDHAGEGDGDVEEEGEAG